MLKVEMLFNVKIYWGSSLLEYYSEAGPLSFLRIEYHKRRIADFDFIRIAIVQVKCWDKINSTIGGSSRE